MLKRFILSIFVITLNFITIQAQLSRKHYIPPITSDGLDPVTTQYIFISTPKTTNVAYRIIPVGNPNIDAYSGTVSNENPVAQPILSSTGASTNFGENSQLHISILNIGNTIRNKGFIIEADDLIYVSIRVRSTSTFQAGALVSKGSSALGTDFRIGGFRTQGPPVNGHATFASVMATEDNTTITIDELPPGIRLVNAPSLPITTQLNTGESYVVAVTTSSGGDPVDLIGGRIRSDKPVVVNIGSATGSFGLGNGGRDYGYDQIVGADKVGTEYILVRGDGSNPWENALVIAHEDNTEVSVNGNPISLLNAGQHVVIEGNEYSFSDNMYINTSNPVFVYQGIGGIGPEGIPAEPNQGLFFVPPLSCESVGDVDNIAFIDEVDESGDVFRGGVTIVTNTGANVQINGEPIANYGVFPSNVTAKPDYVTYRVKGLSGNVSVSSDKELYCAYFNQNGFATTGSFYSGFLSPEIEFNSNSSSSGDLGLIGSCIPNVRLEVSNAALLENLQWQYFDEITNRWTDKANANTNTYTPNESEPGRYRVRGTIQCTGTAFESPEVVVSICPNDFDGDLIIDNIDVDIDNDGILNIDESRGDVTIDLTDINTPVLKFSDGTSDTTIASSSPPDDLSMNSFIGDENGNFSSTIATGSTTSNSYSIAFNQPVNFKLSQRENLPHTASNVNYFTLKIEPNNLNITLIDPDDQLVVDTDFDGDFNDEFPSTLISASEIRFRFRENLNSNEATYQFVANDITEITFTHEYGGSESSSFHGAIGLRYFSKDTDKDGISDYKDLDSDNDGIPDRFENFGENIILSNEDSNQNGLDDVFESMNNSFNPDSDGDGVLNYLDLDSDNDGIFDVFEAGHGAEDTNFDGTIDIIDLANLGENGWLNLLETTADSGSLNYTVSDVDADGFADFLSIDADGDGCFDVIEAGFTGNGSGVLAPDPLIVDEFGIVQNSDGYKAPSLIYRQNGTITYTIPETIEVCENSNVSIFVDSNADQYQWQVSNDNGVNWTNLTDDTTTYSGTNSNELLISNTSLALHNNQYRVLLNRDTYACDDLQTTVTTLTVNALPVINGNSFAIEECISELVDENERTISLRGVESRITQTPDVEFRYYLDANTTNEIADPNSYPFTIQQSERLYVRVTSASGCVSPEVITLDVNVGFADAELTLPGVQSIECDDVVPGISTDTDFETQFSLDQIAIENEIKSNPNITENVIIEYYENLDDRTKAINPIDITNFRNTIAKNDIVTVPTGVQFPIYFKLISTINSACEGVGFFTVQIDAVPEAFSIPDIELCDDVFSGSSTDGSTANINLRDHISEILGPNQQESDYSVSFHTSPEGASTNTDRIENDENYQNLVPDTFTSNSLVEQEIYVRVESRSSQGCFNANTSFKIRIFPLPTLPEPLEILLVCDSVDDLRDRISTVDLTVKTEAILNGRSNLEVVYYASEQDAQNFTEIQNPTSYTTDSSIIQFPSDMESDDPAIQTIYFRLIDQTGIQCPSLISSFDVVIYPEPAIQPIAAVEECDNDDDGDDTNGIIQSFDLISKRTEILAGRALEDYEITFHRSQEDADSGNEPLALNYTNENPTETIFVRMVQKISGCTNSSASFELKVNALPDYNVSSPQIICLNDLPYTIGVENPQEAYQYVWTDDTGLQLGQNENLTISKGGWYTVTATNPNTGCVRVERIQVNESNVATLLPEFIEVVDDINNNNNEYSVRIDTLTHNLGIGDYEFAIRNNDTNERIPFAGYQEDPFFVLEGGGMYEVIVNDKNGCVPPATQIVSVIEFPKFFTPNADSINDFWTIKGASVTLFPSSSIQIFNRFGKLIAVVPLESPGWDGTYQGNHLPADDYWYKITLVPADPNKAAINRTGHFSLIR